jgi:hypothetical protein
MNTGVRRRGLMGLVVAGGMMVAMGRPVGAHHSFAAEFDIDRAVKVKGALARLALTNPHGWVYIDVKGTDGKTEQWSFETNNGAALAKKGFTKSSVAIGTEIVIEGFLSKGLPRRGSLQRMTYPDGRLVFEADRPDVP